MHLKSIKREMSHTINIGNFESIKPTVMVEGELDPGEDLIDAQLELEHVTLDMWKVAVVADLEVALSRRPDDPALQKLLYFYKNN